MTNKIYETVKALNDIWEKLQLLAHEKDIAMLQREHDVLGIIEVGGSGYLYEKILEDLVFRPGA